MTKPTFRVTVRASAAVLAAVAAGIFTVPAQAQTSSDHTKFVYTCIDAGGRALTSDRLIDTCLDREQRVLNAQGVVVKIIPAGITAVQRAQMKAEANQAQVVQQRQRSQDRLDDSLISRYPTRAEHEAARHDALASTEASLVSGKAALAALENEHKSLVAQPPTPKSKGDLTINNNAIKTQQAIDAGYEADIARINAQYDAEDKRLQPLWSGQSAQPANAAAAH